RVFGDIEMQNTATVVGEDDENIEHTELYGRDREEVDRYHLADVISKKRHPGLRWRSRLLGHQPRYRPFRNLKSQLSQFSMDSRCSPCWIGGGHRVDGFPDLGTGSWSGRVFRLGYLSPIPSEPLAIPGRYGFGPHEYQRGFPVLPNQAKADPK